MNLKSGFIKALICIFTVSSSVAFGSCFFEFAQNIENIKFNFGSDQDVLRDQGVAVFGRRPFYTVNNSNELNSLINYYKNLNPSLLKPQIDQFPADIQLIDLLPQHTMKADFANDELINCHGACATFSNEELYDKYVSARGETTSYDNRNAEDVARAAGPRFRKLASPKYFDSRDMNEIFDFIKSLNLKPGDVISIYLPDAGLFGVSHEVVYLGHGLVYSKPGPGKASIILLDDVLIGYRNNFYSSNSSYSYDTASVELTFHRPIGPQSHFWDYVLSFF